MPVIFCLSFLKLVEAIKRAVSVGGSTSGMDKMADGQ